MLRGVSYGDAHHRQCRCEMRDDGIAIVESTSHYTPQAQLSLSSPLFGTFNTPLLWQSCLNAER